MNQLTCQVLWRKAKLIPSVRRPSFLPPAAALPPIPRLQHALQPTPRPRPTTHTLLLTSGVPPPPCARDPTLCLAAPREFDFSRYRTRYVALELMYVGWAFQGFARQDTTENTIEVGAEAGVEGARRGRRGVG